MTTDRRAQAERIYDESRRLMLAADRDRWDLFDVHLANIRAVVGPRHTSYMPVRETRRGSRMVTKHG